jgi:hypothetical protein
MVPPNEDTMTDEPLPAPVPPAATAVVKFDRWKLPLLVREVVMDCNELATILQTFNIDLPTFQALETTDEYKALFERLFAEWHRADSTEGRLKIQSAFLLEQALPKLGAKVTADGENLRDQVEAAKFLKQLAGIGDTTAAKIGERFAITINMGAQQVVIEKNIAPNETAPGGPSSVPDDAKGTLTIPTLELVAEGPRSNQPVPTDD